MRMTKAQRTYARQNTRNMKKTIFFNLAVCYIIMIITLVQIINANRVEYERLVNESHQIQQSFEADHQPISHPLEGIESTEAEESVSLPYYLHSKDWDAEESYLLAKIAMCEAEGCDLKTKEYVIYVVLNRVWDEGFPGTIEEVIFQYSNGVYQFSPVSPGGRWERVEPNDDCWLAVWNVMSNPYDPSEGALWFESNKDPDNWHSRNLEFLYESGGIRFYR